MQKYLYHAPSQLGRCDNVCTRHHRGFQYRAHARAQRRVAPAHPGLRRSSDWMVQRQPRVRLVRVFAVLAAQTAPAARLDGWFDRTPPQLRAHDAQGMRTLLSIFPSSRQGCVPERVNTQATPTFVVTGPTVSHGELGSELRLAALRGNSVNLAGKKGRLTQ